MRFKEAAMTSLPVAAIILQLLPYGAVLNFARPADDGSIGHFRETYSYFSLVPFGYANFGPLFTAILTCVLLILAVISLFKYSKGLNNAIKTVSSVAVITSIMPLMFGAHYFSIVGAFISALLGSYTVLLYINDKQSNKKEKRYG